MNEIAKEEEGTGLEVVKFDVNDAQISAVAAKFADIEIIPGDAVTYKTVMKGLAEHRDIRLKIETRKKELSKSAMVYVKSVQVEAKRLQELNEPGETRLRTIRFVEDTRVAQIETDRVNGIREKITAIERLDYDLGKKTAVELETLYAVLQHTPITEEDYQEFVGEAMANLHNTTIKIKEAWDYQVKRDTEEEIRKAEDERLAKIREEQKTEARRLAKIAEEQEEKRIIEGGLKQLAADAIAEERQEIQAEKDKLEGEKKAIQDKKDQEILEKKLAEQAKVRAEQEVKDKAKREAERTAREEALRPDKDKVLAFVQAFLDVPLPDVEGEEMQAISLNAKKLLRGVADRIFEQIDHL